MWVGAHLLAGATVYEVVRRKPLWAKVSLALAGGFVSHWVLDEIGAYHGLHGPWWYWGILIGVHVLAVSAIVRKGRWYLLSGLWAWLCWDFEWILGSQGRWIHLSGIFPRYIRDVYALDSLGIQVGLMVILSLILLIPCRELHRRSEPKKQVQQAVAGVSMYGSRKWQTNGVWRRVRTWAESDAY
jgi:hypothetical protein